MKLHRSNPTFGPLKISSRVTRALHTHHYRLGVGGVPGLVRPGAAIVEFKAVARVRQFQVASLRCGRLMAGIRRTPSCSVAKSSGRNRGQTAGLAVLLSTCALTTSGECRVNAAGQDLSQMRLVEAVRPLQLEG